MHDRHSASPTHQGFRGGLFAALVVFALTWFMVNGADVPHRDTGARATHDPSLCVVPNDIPTSRFLNAPLPTPRPWPDA